MPTDGEVGWENPLDDLAVSSVLGGYPAVADRELPKTLDGLLVAAEPVSEGLPAEDSDDADGPEEADGAAVAEDGDDGVLHTESAAGEPLAE